MKKKHIVIQGIADVTTFVIKANEVFGDVTCRRGKYTVDGKSLMGLMSLDVSQGVIVEYPDDATEFENFIQQFSVK